MVYDCFQFFNELDILQMRMNVMNDIVDKFVISESTVTFSGDPKKLYYAENKKRFAQFEDKIIHNVVDDTPMDCTPFVRDSHQKCAVARGLKDAKPDDIVIFSDKFRFDVYVQRDLLFFMLLEYLNIVDADKTVSDKIDTPPYTAVRYICAPVPSEHAMSFSKVLITLCASRRSIIDHLTARRLPVLDIIKR